MLPRKEENPVIEAIMRKDIEAFNNLGDKVIRAFMNLKSENCNGNTAFHIAIILSEESERCHDYEDVSIFQYFYRELDRLGASKEILNNSNQTVSTKKIDKEEATRLGITGIPETTE